MRPCRIRLCVGTGFPITCKLGFPDATPAGQFVAGAPSAVPIGAHNVRHNTDVLPNRPAQDPGGVWRFLPSHAAKSLSSSWLASPTRPPRESFCAAECCLMRLRASFSRTLNGWDRQVPRSRASTARPSLASVETPRCTSARAIICPDPPLCALARLTSSMLTVSSLISSRVTLRLAFSRPAPCTRATMRRSTAARMHPATPVILSRIASGLVREHSALLLTTVALVAVPQLLHHLLGSADDNQ